tara:strand:- start:180339 stop:181040 length:702 start_codon:yes stop_codon:yes gene_type:complete
MKINRNTKIPELWKPFPYAIDPEWRDGKLFYVLGLTGERVMGLVLFGGVTLIFVLLSVWQVAAGSGGGLIRPSWLIFSITACFTASFLWSVYSSRKRSQVCVNLVDGQTQIQYQHKENAMVDHGEICVIIAQLAKQRDWPSKGFDFLVWAAQKFEGKDVNLVVIRAGSDFEIVGAFKSFDPALEFAQVVQSESGLEIVEDEMPELLLVDAQRSYGTEDSKAMKQRFQSQPFRA